MLQSFKPHRQYLVVVPTLDEIRRVQEASSVPFVQPETSRVHKTKREHLEALLCEGANIATTHALYMDVAVLAREGLLDDYEIIIDEVLDVCAKVDGKSPRSFERFYLGCQYAIVGSDGRVSSTPKWDAEVDAVADTLDVRLHRMAKAGMLYYIDNTFFMWALPRELLSAGRSFTVYTYLAEGSMLLPYLRKLGVPYDHDVDPVIDAEFRRKARNLIEIRDIPKLKRVSLSYSGQKASTAKAKTVASALRSIRRGALGDIPLENTLVTCVKDNWYRKGDDDAEKRKAGPFAANSKMFEGVNWIANTTRGTNNYAHCSHLIYLYDQNMNPYIRRWLGLVGDPSAQDRYALTELIQWVYRSRARRGKPIVLYLPSARMRGLLKDWVTASDGEVDWQDRTPMAA
jgi:hypothetical protein